MLVDAYSHLWQAGAMWWISPLIGEQSGVSMTTTADWDDPDSCGSKSVSWCSHSRAQIPGLVKSWVTSELQVLKQAAIHISLFCWCQKAFSSIHRLEKTLRQSRPRSSFYKWRNWGPRRRQLPQIRKRVSCRIQQESLGPASWVGDLSTIPHHLSSPLLPLIPSLQCPPFLLDSQNLVREPGDVCYEKQLYSSVLLWSYLGVGWREQAGRSQVAWPAWLLCILMGSPLVTPSPELPHPEGHIAVTKQSGKRKQ